MTEPLPLTERRIQRALWASMHGSYSILMPNFTPAGWFECDVWGLTKAGYAVEFEIKLSLTDFRADQRKRDNNHYMRDGQDGWTYVPGRHKHELLAEASLLGPSRFWYVVPAGLLGADAVPEWAGIIEATATGRRARITRVRPAPRLHRVKAGDAIMRKALSACYFRYWTERDRLDYLIAQNEMPKAKET